MTQRTRSDGTPAQARPARGDAPKRPTFFLRTKLLPPRPASVLLSRPRLTKCLQANLSHPITLVTAPAGSGRPAFVAKAIGTDPTYLKYYSVVRSDSEGEEEEEE